MRKRDRDPTAGRRIFRGVVDKVSGDLNEPHGIAEDAQRLAAGRRLDAVAILFDKRLACLQRVAQNGPHVDKLFAQLDLASADARDFKKIVDEPHEMIDLIINRRKGRANIFKSHAARVSDPEDVRRRVAKLAEPRLALA